ncbi:MAG: MarR family winged helix-turn-helix transcriptional regulator, partial [Dissulfurimicrobium sp.]
MKNDFNIDNCLGFIANRLVKEFQRSFDEKLSQYNLTCAQFCVLMKLFDGDGLTQTELADRLYIENPTLVRTLDRLEASGLIERRRSPRDRRVYHV